MALIGSTQLYRSLISLPTDLSPAAPILSFQAVWQILIWLAHILARLSTHSDPQLYHLHSQSQTLGSQKSYPTKSLMLGTEICLWDTEIAETILIEWFGILIWQKHGCNLALVQVIYGLIGIMGSFRNVSIKSQNKSIKSLQIPSRWCQLKSPFASLSSLSQRISFTEKMWKKRWQNPQKCTTSKAKVKEIQVHTYKIIENLS